MVIGSKAPEGQTGHEAGRELLAQMYRQQTGKEMPAIAVTDRGKPYFIEGDVHFSISHTGKCVFCVLSDRPVGIDAESTDRIIDPKLAEKILSPAEKARYENAPDKNTALLRLWVQKEAYAKLCGRGWGSYLYDTEFDPESPAVQEMKGCFVAVLEEKDNAI